MIISILLDAIFLPLLIIAGYYDVKTRLIPVWVSVALLVTAIAHMAAVWSFTPLLGLLPAILIYALLYRDGRGIGGADIQTIGGMGLYFGLSAQLIIALLVACIGGIVWDMVRRICKFKLRHESIPFCAFLAAGGVAGMVLNQTIL